MTAMSTAMTATQARLDIAIVQIGGGQTLALPSSPALVVVVVSTIDPEYLSSLMRAHTITAKSFPFPHHDSHTTTQGSFHLCVPAL